MSFPPPPERNRRIAPRRALRQAVTVAYGGTSKVVQTWDLGREGMCLLAARPIAPGTRCQVTFDLPLGKELIHITASVKVVYSSYSAAGDFKIGAVFMDLADDAALALGKFAASS